jgi:hypothetical protein
MRRSLTGSAACFAYWYENPALKHHKDVKLSLYYESIGLIISGTGKIWWIGAESKRSRTLPAIR